MPSILDLSFTGNMKDSEIGYIPAFTEASTPIEVFQRALESDLSNIDQMVPVGSLSGDAIDYLEVRKLRTGTISSQQITLGLTEGKGDIYIGGGTFSASAWTATGGFLMGLDDSDSNKVKFFLGDATTSVDWNVTTADTLTVK